MRFSEFLCYLHLWGTPFLTVISIVFYINRPTEIVAVIMAVIIMPFFLFKTIRRIWVKELFILYYSRRYDVHTTHDVQDVPMDSTEYKTSVFHQLLSPSIPYVYNARYIGFLSPIHLYKLMPSVIFVFTTLTSKPTIIRGVSVLLGAMVVYIVVHLWLHGILEKHFENPNNIIRYYPLYWHCKHFFKKHNRRKNPDVPQARCVWKKLILNNSSINKIPYMYFDAIFWNFTTYVIIIPVLLCFPFCVTLDDTGRNRTLKHAINSIKTCWNTMYDVLHKYHVIIDTMVLVVVITCTTLYVRWILQTLVYVPVESNTKKTAKRHNSTWSFLYVKTVPRTSQKISFSCALKWSIPIIIAVYIFKIVNRYDSNNWIILIDLVYILAFLYTMYIALQYHISNYNDIYIKIFSYKSEQFEFYKLTDNWKW